MKDFFSANAPPPRSLIFLMLGLLLLACGGLGSSDISDATPTPTSLPDTATARPPTPARTVTSQATDVIPLDTPASPTPTGTATNTPTPTPTPTDTPAIGIVAGQITFRHASGEIRPDTEATVELLGNTSSAYRSTNTNTQGRYRLADIPAGQYWVLARSSVGATNPEDVAVTAGETAVVDLSTFSYYPLLLPRAAGGRVKIDGQPVAGAKVWRFGGLLESNKLAITDETGYFSFPYLEDTPIVALSGDRWTVTTLEPNEIIDIELDRTGPHPPPPDGPVVTPVPVEEDVVIIVPTPPTILPPRWTPEIRIIVPTLPSIVRPTRLAIPTVGIQEIATVAPPARVTLQRPVVQPTLAPRLPAAPSATPAIPTACGQTKSAIDYGPIKTGSTVVLGRHEPVKKTDSWDKPMEKFVDSKATVTRLAGLDTVGCPLVQVDVDDGQFQWRIRAMTLLEP